MYSAGATFSAHLTGMAEDILEAVNFSSAALKETNNFLMFALLRMTSFLTIIYGLYIQ